MAAGNAWVFCPYPSYRQEKPGGSQITEPPLWWGRSVGIRVSRNNLHSKQKHEQVKHLHPEPVSSSPHGPTGGQARSVGWRSVQMPQGHLGAAQGIPRTRFSSHHLSRCGLCLILLHLVVFIKRTRNGKCKCQQGGQGRPPSVPAA